MILVTGYSGVLGKALLRHDMTRPYLFRLELDEPEIHAHYDSAILCAGTKGFHECDGNDAVFQADVDGNIRLIRGLLKRQVFTVFISTEAVERIGHRAAYSSNRLLVEQFLWGQENNAIIRPGRFDSDTVQPLADLCIKVATDKRAGIHHWP